MTRTKRNNSLGHPFRAIFHPILVTLLVCSVLALAAVPAFSAPASRGGLPDQKRKPADDLLIFGTTFSEQGFAVQGAKIEVRRAGEKKVRWRAVSDRRGEFGIRVPIEGQYEVTIEARGYMKAERKIDGKGSQRFDFVERLKPVAPVAKERGRP